MSKKSIEQFIGARVSSSGMIETGIRGVQLFKITESIRCAPAVYEPSVTAIVGGDKEAILDGQRHTYDSSKYLCCTLSMPIEAGTPNASEENPLTGVYITLDTKMMTELVIEMQSTTGAVHNTKCAAGPQGLTTASWDDDFTEALYRLIKLADSRADSAILSNHRLRELYYTILKGEAGYSARRSFGIGNEIARSIEFLSSNLANPVTIEEIADKIGMSRAVFHRKFKQATNMSPIQFVKSMRLNNAAMRIAGGTHVNVAAMENGYVSSSQFSRDFKRLYGHSPKQWSQANEKIKNSA